jgi:nickel/cobalt exporter
MTPFADLLREGTAHAWLFAPTAILLGALHGLEPGHSKTMMAAFIVAVRGTVTQAVLLGLSATLSHTLVVWGVALLGLHFGQNMDVEANEGWFQLASGVIILMVALWMLWRTWRDLHPHGHHHHHGHHDHGGHHHGHDHHHDHHHDHDEDEPQGAHERQHAMEIERRFAGRAVTSPQIILFGLTGGLIPCPAAITVLLLCLQLKEFSLGVALVLCFSIGLALTLVLVGVAAALSVRHAANRWPGFNALARRAPYFSAGLILLVGLYVCWSGWHSLQTL